MKGVGVFFNVMEDLERIVSIADKIDWIAPIMAPDQSSVQNNRREWNEWRRRLRPEGVRFAVWIVNEDPVEDYDRLKWVLANYEAEDLLFNAEKPYESTGKWKGFSFMQLVMGDPKMAAMRKLMSYPSTPAEQYDMDYRAFERAGCYFGPQAYWLDPLVAGFDATPKALFDSTYLPKQLHVGRDYRLQINKVREKHWGRVVQWSGKDANHCIVKDLASTKLYRCPIKVMYDGDYAYMVPQVKRKLMDYKTGKIEQGRILGFQVPEKIVPSVGVYPNCRPSPEQVKIQLNRIPNLTGASLYLGETSTSKHIEAVWEAVYA